MLPFFYLNDDVMMKSILSGAYSGSPDGHAVYMKYPLTGILSLLYRLFGRIIPASIPWFSLFLGGCVLLVTLTVLLSFIRFYKGEKLPLWQSCAVPAVGILLCTGLILPQFFYMHYTIISALLCGAGIFAWILKKKKGLAIFLLLLAFQVRSQVFFLCLPFLGLAILWELAKYQKLTKGEFYIALKRQLIGGGILLSGVLLCFVINTAFYSSPEWKNYTEYNTYRTQLYDYTDFLSSDYYVEHYEEIGLNNEQFQILSHYNTILDNRLDAQMLKATADKISASMQEYADPVAYFKQCLKNYYFEIRYHDASYGLLWISCALLLFIVLLFRRKYLHIALLLCLEAGRSCIWVYLIWQGRFPERISKSLYLIEILLLLGLLLGELSYLKNKKVISISALVFLLPLLLFNKTQWQNTRDSMDYQISLHEEWTILSKYCRENTDTLYLADVFSVMTYGRLQYEQDAANLFYMGGWLTSSPLTQKRLSEYNADDAAEALLHPNVRMIAKESKDITWLEEYLQTRFDNVELRLTDTVYCNEDTRFNIYKLEKLTN